MRSTNNTRTLQQTKSVSFASQAIGPAAGAIWYSTEELSSLCTNCPTNYHYHADTDAIDAILDAQEILDGVGVADVASQANILAAVSAKCSAKARHRAYANAKKIHASCYYLGLPSDSSSLHAPEETIPPVFEDGEQCYQRHDYSKDLSVTISKEGLPAVSLSQEVLVAVVPGGITNTTMIH